MILTLTAPFGTLLNLDFTDRFGALVELECFHFVTPPIEFRLSRLGRPLQEWQTANTEMYDLQHGPGAKKWCRNGHWFTNDLHHRTDVATCGVLSRDLVMDTRCLGLNFILHVWLRESTVRADAKVKHQPSRRPGSPVVRVKTKGRIAAKIGALCSKN